MQKLGKVGRAVPCAPHVPITLEVPHSHSARQGRHGLPPQRITPIFTVVFIHSRAPLTMKTSTWWGERTREPRLWMSHAQRLVRTLAPPPATHHTHFHSSSVHALSCSTCHKIGPRPVPGRSGSS